MDSERLLSNGSENQDMKKLPQLQSAGSQGEVVTAPTSQEDQNSDNVDTKILKNNSEESPRQADAFDMRKTYVRWIMLGLACCFLLGSYFCYDNPGPLETQLERDFHMNSATYALLYTVYSAPNMVLPIFGGLFLDKIGIRAGLVLFTCILTLGQFVFMIGGYQQNFPMMLAGRVLFGMGGECMCVAQSSIVSVWFKGKELAFALGLNLSISRLGSVANAAIVPGVYDAEGLGMALTVGFVVCIFSLVAAFGLVYLDKRREQSDPQSENAQVDEGDAFKWSDLYDFGKSYWILTASCVITYMSVFPYIMNLSDILQSKYGFDKVHAGYLFGLPYIISASISPFLGFTIDKVGKRAFLITMSSVLLTIAFTASMMMPECHQCYNETYPLVVIGIGYSIYASACWGSVPYVVRPQSVGTAFGITTAIQNIGLVIAPTLVGYIKDKTRAYDHGFMYMNAFFVLINIIGFLLNASLYYIDVYERNGILESTDPAGMQKRMIEKEKQLLQADEQKEKLIPDAPTVEQQIQSSDNVSAKTGSNLNKDD